MQRLKAQLPLTPREADAWLLIRRQHTPAARQARISNCNPREQIAAGRGVITKEKENKRMALHAAGKQKSSLFFSVTFFESSLLGGFHNTIHFQRRFNKGWHFIFG